MKKFLLFIIMSIVSMNVMADGMMAHDAYVRLLPPTAKTTGAFMTLMNHGMKDYKLVKAESDAADKVELHNHVKVDGMMKMREVSHIAIKQHGAVELKPGSYHVMLIGLKKPLKKGQVIKIKLHFDDKSTIDVEAPVKEVQVSKGMKHHNH
jgi:copper(I)-binding protein